jgi:secreted trypsin-like serine protease
VGAMPIPAVMRRFSLLFCLLALAAAGPAAAVTGGAFDGNAHPYVGMATDGSTLCSGTLVAPRVFVTAAHCFADGAVVHLGFDPQPTPPLPLSGTAYDDPQFCAGCGKGTAGVAAHDLAVVILDAPAPGPYASLPSVNLVDALPKHAAVTVVGFGVQGFDGKGKKAQPVDLHQRYAGDAELANPGGKMADAFVKLSGKGSSAAPCFGDSGGPDLLPGTDTMVGVTSWGKGDTCDKASYSYRVDTQASLDFIAGVVAAHT